MNRPPGAGGGGARAGGTKVNRLITDLSRTINIGVYIEVFRAPSDTCFHGGFSFLFRCRWSRWRFLFPLIFWGALRPAWETWEANGNGRDESLGREEKLPF